MGPTRNSNAITVFTLIVTLIPTCMTLWQRIEKKLLGQGFSSMNFERIHLQYKTPLEMVQDHEY
jgi:hypothetical protein